MADDGYGGADPFFMDEAAEEEPASEPVEASTFVRPGASLPSTPPPAEPVTTDRSLQEPSGGAPKESVELPPPPDDHADYGLVATEGATEPTPQPEASSGLSWSVPTDLDATPDYEQPQPYEQPQAYEEKPAYAEPGPVVDLPSSPAPASPAPASPAVPLVPPPMFTASDMPAILPPPTAPMEDAPAAPAVEATAPGGHPAVSGAPLLGGSDVATAPAESGAPLLAPRTDPSQADIEGAGLQGPEFQALRSQAMDVPMVGIPAAEEERSTSVASEFSARPATMHGRSPVNLSSRTTRIGIAVVALLVGAFLVMRLLPKGDDDTGTHLALVFAQGDTQSYRVAYTSTSDIAGEGMPTDPVTTSLEATVDLRTTQRGSSALAVLAQHRSGDLGPGSRWRHVERHVDGGDGVHRVVPEDEPGRVRSGLVDASRGRGRQGDDDIGGAGVCRNRELGWSLGQPRHVRDTALIELAEPFAVGGWREAA